MIYFQFSIFEPLSTAPRRNKPPQRVVIYFQFSIFEPLSTAVILVDMYVPELWFTFNLVSLNHWVQHYQNSNAMKRVVIYFQFSIFEPLSTALLVESPHYFLLWFTFNLVSLNHWVQLRGENVREGRCCDLLSI